MDSNNTTPNIDFLSEEDRNALMKAYERQIECYPKARPEKIFHVLFSYYAMRELMKMNRKTRAKVTYAIFSPTQNMGVVSIIGKKISIKDHELFMRVIGLATNFEVYPKTDGTVNINFTFHGLTN